MNHPIVLAITGASGAVYAVRLLRTLLAGGREVHLTISPSGREVLAHELQIQVDLDRFSSAGLLGDLPPDAAGRLSFYQPQNFFAPMASGSFRTDGMVICPCSGGTLSAVVHGSSVNLIHRAADVHLKERRNLIVVPRETPLSLIHLENMKRACELGAVVLPAMPGWYHGVRSVDDLVDFVVARILDQLGVEHQLMRRWGEAETSEKSPTS